MASIVRGNPSSCYSKASWCWSWWWSAHRTSYSSEPREYARGLLKTSEIRATPASDVVWDCFRESHRLERADERTRTADLLITSDRSALQGVAQPCKSRISKGFSLLCLAERCTVLRSRWYRSGIKNHSAIDRFWLIEPALCRIADTNFREDNTGEVRRIYLLRTPMNTADKARVSSSTPTFFCTL
jgi:hypothetical protein